MNRPAAAPGERRWTVGRVLLVVFGVIASLVGLAFLVAGAGLLWLSAQRDADGFLTVARGPVTTPTYAVTSTRFPWQDGADGAYPSGLFGTVRITATSNDPGRRLFVGVAPSAQVRDYLAGVPHDEVTGVQQDPFRVSYRTVPGTARPVPPAVQPFWTAIGTGGDPQTLTWAPQTGNGTVVLMNAGGGARVDAQVRVGVTVPALGWSSAVLLVLGVILLVGGALMVAFGAHHSTRPPAPNST